MECCGIVFHIGLGHFPEIFFSKSSKKLYKNGNSIFGCILGQNGVEGYFFVILHFFEKSKFWYMSFFWVDFPEKNIICPKSVLTIGKSCNGLPLFGEFVVVFPFFCGHFSIFLLSLFAKKNIQFGAYLFGTILLRILSKMIHFGTHFLGIFLNKFTKGWPWKCGPFWSLFGFGQVAFGFWLC